MPEAAMQLLLVGALVLMWHRRYKRLQHQSAHLQARRRPEIRAILDRMRKEHAERSVARAEAAPSAEAPSEHPAPKQSSMPKATGVAGIVATNRRLIRCTEYDLDGEFQTEICKVDANGGILGKRRVVPGPFRCVALDVLNKKIG